MLPELPKTPEEAMRFDPLAEAERITGKSYKEDKDTEALGLQLHFAHVQNKRRVMENAGDTDFSCSMIKFDHILRSNGFEPVGAELVESDRCWLYWHAYWRSPGQLLLCEYLDWIGERGAEPSMCVNNAKCWYNWRPDSTDNHWEYTSSGHFAKDEDDLVWIGDHDAREGIITSLNRLAANGEFLEPWVETPMLWAVVGNKETPKGYDPNFDYHEATMRRLRAHLPENIQTLIRLDEYDAAEQARRAARLTK